MKPVLPAMLMAPLLLAACAQPTKTVVVPVITTPGDTCGAARYKSLVGQTGPALMLPADAVYRISKPGDMVTADLNPARLNFETDARGKLLRVSCG